MKKYFIALVLFAVTPSIAFASWWNPLSWNWTDFFNTSTPTIVQSTTTLTIQARTIIQNSSTTTNVSVVSTPTTTPIVPKKIIKKVSVPVQSNVTPDVVTTAVVSAPVPQTVVQPTIATTNTQTTPTPQTATSTAETWAQQSAQQQATYSSVENINNEAAQQTLGGRSVACYQAEQNIQSLVGQQTNETNQENQTGDYNNFSSVEGNTSAANAAIFANEMTAALYAEQTACPTEIYSSQQNIDPSTNATIVSINQTLSQSELSGQQQAIQSPTTGSFLQCEEAGYIQTAINSYNKAILTDSNPSDVDLYEAQLTSLQSQENSLSQECNSD